MADLSAALSAFLASPEGLAVKALLVAAFVVFALGVLAALRDGTFSLVYVGSFIRSDIMGKVAPVSVVLLAGYIAHVPELTAAGLAAAAIVAGGMLGSAIESIRQLGTDKAASAARNAAPTG